MPRILLISLLIISPKVFAEDSEALFLLPDVVAIENKLYDKQFEISVTGSYLPSNAYNRYIGTGLGLYYKLSPSWKWEAIRYDFLRDTPTNLRGELENEFAIDVQSQFFGGRFLPMRSIARTGILWSPFYNKGLFANRKVIYSNLSIVANFGQVFFKERSDQMMAGVGGIYQIYVATSLSVKFDIRHNFIFDSTQGTVDFSEVSVGFSYHFGESNKQ
jgi:outer membrane beta-barrel protein